MRSPLDGTFNWENVRQMLVCSKRPDPHLDSSRADFLMLNNLLMLRSAAIYSVTCRDYTRPDLPSGSEGELAGAANVPDLSAALAGEQ